MNEDITALRFTQWLTKRKAVGTYRQLLVLTLADVTPIEAIPAICDSVQGAIESIALAHPDAIYVGNFISHLNAKLQRNITAHQLQHHLGHQYSALIMDCREGLQANHLYASAGLVQDAGLLILIAPPVSIWPKYYAQHNILRFSYKKQPSDSLFSTLLLKRFLGDKRVAWQGNEHTELPFSTIDKANKRSNIDGSLVLSPKQTAILQSIGQSWQNQSNSCHFIFGARGRGKSTLLAKICELAIQDNQTNRFANIALCAPTLAQREIVHSFISTGHHDGVKLLNIAPDQAQLLHPNTLLLVDEAASISPTLLSQLCSKAQHVVIAATTQGYEGSGQGLLYRWLPNLTRNIQRHQLNSPFRWQQNDVLEALLEHIFQPTLPALSIRSPKKLGLHLYDKALLIQHDALFDACFALLQAAHYQTSPNDIMRMLDARDHEIWGYSDTDAPYDPQSLVGLICTIDEGGADVFNDLNLCIDIANGNRRVQGHMGLQSLSFALHRPEILLSKIHRIHRIAVRPDLQHAGIGSAMLKCLCNKQNELAIDGFSTSYGLTAGLERFWRKNGFNLVKIGHRKDTSSTTVTGHYLLNNSELNLSTFNNTQAHLKMDIQYFERYRMDIFATLPNVVVSACKQIENNHHPLSLAKTKLTLFIEHKMSYAMARSSILFVALLYKDKELLANFNAHHQKHLSKADKKGLELLIKKRLGAWLFL